MSCAHKCCSSNYHVSGVGEDLAYKKTNEKKEGGHNTQHVCLRPREATSIGRGPIRGNHGRRICCGLISTRVRRAQEFMLGSSRTYNSPLFGQTHGFQRLFLHRVSVGTPSDVRPPPPGAHHPCSQRSVSLSCISHGGEQQRGRAEDNART